MNIAIDIRALQTGHQFRGIGAYLQNVLTKFPYDTSEHTYIFLRYGDSNPLADLELKLDKYKEIVIERPEDVNQTASGKLFSLVKKQYTPQFGNLNDYKPDVFFQPDFILGLPGGRMKKYVVMYDLIPLVLKNYYMPSWRKLLTQPGLGKKRRLRIVAGAWVKERGYMNALKKLNKANKIFCISQATANDLHEILGLPTSKLVVTPLAASIPDVKVTDSDKPEAVPKNGNPYLLFMGGVDERRKLSHLIHAFNLLNGRGHNFDLVLAGKELGDVKLIPNVEARNAILDSSYRDSIHLAGYVSQKEKVWLLKNAFAFVYPTLYEGFGLPILEAMHEGCPAISYNNSSLPEIAGNAGILLNEHDGTSIANAVIKLRKDPSRRSGMARLGKEQAKKFSWESCAKTTYSILIKAGRIK